MDWEMRGPSEVRDPETDELTGYGWGFVRNGRAVGLITQTPDPPGEDYLERVRYAFEKAEKGA